MTPEDANELREAEAAVIAEHHDAVVRHNASQWGVARAIHDASYWTALTQTDLPLPMRTMLTLVRAWQDG